MQLQLVAKGAVRNHITQIFEIPSSLGLIKWLQALNFEALKAQHVCL